MEIAAVSDDLSSNELSSKRRKLDLDQVSVSVEQIVRQFSALSDSSNEDGSAATFRSRKSSADFDDNSCKDIFSRRHLVRRIEQDEEKQISETDVLP
jgi:hypothetical protein